MAVLALLYLHFIVQYQYISIYMKFKGQSREKITRRRFIKKPGRVTN